MDGSVAMQGSACAFRLFRRLTPSSRLEHFHGHGQPRMALRCTICNFPFHRSVLQPGQSPPLYHLARFLASRRTDAGTVQCCSGDNGAGRHLLPAGHASLFAFTAGYSCGLECGTDWQLVGNQGARRSCPRPSNLRRRSRRSMIGGAHHAPAGPLNFLVCWGRALTAAHAHEQVGAGGVLPAAGRRHRGPLCHLCATLLPCRPLAIAPCFAYCKTCSALPLQGCANQQRQLQPAQSLS